MTVFIGKLIKDITERRGISKSELGRRLNMSPTNVHKIFKRETIDTGLLHKISEVLEYDFFNHFTPNKEYDPTISQLNLVSEGEIIYKNELALCKEKIQMLEKINALLEEKISHLQKK